MGRRESRPLTNVTINLGLVTIPVELHTATTSLAPSFHLIHERCSKSIARCVSAWWSAMSWCEGMSSRRTST